jgi:hypothetical protein
MEEDKSGEGECLGEPDGGGEEEEEQGEEDGGEVEGQREE